LPSWRVIELGSPPVTRRTVAPTGRAIREAPATRACPVEDRNSHGGSSIVIAPKAAYARKGLFSRAIRPISARACRSRLSFGRIETSGGSCATTPNSRSVWWASTSSAMIAPPLPPKT
jgi:hypothetical protein